MVGFASALGVGPTGYENWPSTPEEYAVMALRLQRERALRSLFRPVSPGALGVSHSVQLLDFTKGITLHAT